MAGCLLMLILYTRLKNGIIRVSVHALIIKNLQEITRAVSVSFPCTFPTFEAQTYALGGVNTAFTGRKQGISACISDFDTDNFHLSI